ncbi:zonular occludens toxin domain-containing protein [Desulfopila aestuarii]|uniref:Zonular occludens toxin (Zot) n=1 Tax=Desulfopila aestuarii DSM 18488 TaxID=1121416 RepID=A0A1M7Y0Y8_9BACT|nr:zonular occludens toxin domain-containing protein [Desulfopila aestuarii]SHO45309.1 Zonular occludens toxin (Zot) [Desulfopila aestuarii DSM 18488]
MIIGYVGTPGSGKTYEAVKCILDNLKRGKVVFTNIDGLEKDTCREMIKNVCGLSDLAITRQLKIFEPDQLEDFWNHVEPQSIIVLDEVQKIFSSREWQSEKNKLFGFWASTHRHHGFEVILITQNPERIDSAVRALFEWTYLFRKVNFFGGAVQKKYICYAYAGDDTHGSPLTKRIETYNPLVFRCYKSYVNDDIQEKDIRKHVNVLKHPIFFIIPVVLCFTLYMLFGKSSLATGDIFGTKKVMASFDKKTAQKKEMKVAPNPARYSDSIIIKEQKNGVRKFSNRI